MFFICDAVLSFNIIDCSTLLIGSNVLLARAIDVVIAIGLAGLSMVPSGATDGEPDLELSLPALCLGFDEGV